MALPVFQEPGSSFSYSGGGTTIVQLLIEDVTQEEFSVWMKKNEIPLLEPTPTYKDGKFYNQKGEEFVIVHQYDRDPYLKNQIKNLYK